MLGLFWRRKDYFDFSFGIASLSALGVHVMNPRLVMKLLALYLQRSPIISLPTGIVRVIQSLLAFSFVIQVTLTMYTPFSSVSLSPII